MNATYVSAGLRSVTAMGNPCGRQPLVNMDLLGVVYFQHNEAHALCCYCGNLTRVTPLKWRRHGISCMNHPHVDEFPLDHFQNAAFRTLVETTIVARTHDFAQPPTTRLPRVQEEADSVLGSYTKRVLYPHPQVLDERVPCAWCGTLTRKVVHLLDDARGLVEVALCNADLGVLDTTLNTQRLGLERAPLTVFAQRLDVWHVLEQVRRTQQRLRDAAAARRARQSALADAEQLVTSERLVRATEAIERYYTPAEVETALTYDPALADDYAQPPETIQGRIADLTRLRDLLVSLYGERGGGGGGGSGEADNDVEYGDMFLS